MNEESREHPDWIAVDWGSSNLRAWAMSDAGDVLARGESPCGMLSLSPDDYETALLAVVGDWIPASGQQDVVVCGMAGARQGWREAAYLAAPTRLDALSKGTVTPVTVDPRLRVKLLPGVCQTGDGHGRDFDVMRGEETQLAGLLAERADFTGTVCLPGTHAKWARLECGELTRFVTFLSGELFHLLAEHSVLAHSLGEDDLSDPGCRAAFIDAVRETATNPGRASARLFGIRARDLLDASLPSGAARGARLAARLSGLVIGLELAGALDDLPPDDGITLIGAEALNARYALALEAVGLSSHCLAGERMVLAGLGLARSALATSRP